MELYSRELGSPDHHALSLIKSSRLGVVAVNVVFEEGNIKRVDGRRPLVLIPSSIPKVIKR